MNEKNDSPVIKRKYGDCEVTITFGEYNPGIKETILDLLCDSFVHRIMNEQRGENDTSEKDSTSDEA